jgi:hypothetical protein
MFKCFMKSVVQVLLVLIFFCNCSRDSKERAPLPLSIEQNKRANPATESSVCPDSAVSYNQYKEYWSPNLPISEDILAEFNITDDELIEISKFAKQEQDKIPTYKTYELFSRGIDGEKILAKKGIAKHLKGESPYDLEYYLIHGDTLIGGADSPTYYYYDQHDSLRVIESYFNDNVEGCTFSKEVKYFKGGKPLLLREYHFYLNCWPSEGDSLNGFRLDGKFVETFQFMNHNAQDFYNREFNFFDCSGSSYIVMKKYNVRHEQEAAAVENTDLVKYN